MIGYTVYTLLRENTLMRQKKNFILVAVYPIPRSHQSLTISSTNLN